MLNFLSSLLSPIFTPMGVSQADLTAYLNQLSGYVYAILFILVAMILLLIFAGKINKKNSGIIRLASVLGALACGHRVHRQRDLLRPHVQQRLRIPERFQGRAL